MHRFVWDLRYAFAGAPRRSRRGAGGPIAVPGRYTVKLTAAGKSISVPLVVKMDPRVKITPEVQQIFTLTTKMEDNARNAAAAYKDARDLIEKLKARPQSAANDELIKKVEALAPVEVAPSGGGRGGPGRLSAAGAGPGAARPRRAPVLPVPEVAPGHQGRGPLASK